MVEDDLQLNTDSIWFKDAVIYQLHVKSFKDSNGDGIGDFQGLTQKLDYLEDLGVNVIWLLPFYPSPLRDDGYDIADYMGIHKSYGTMRDFKTFLHEAHRRGLKVITELVINHTSDQHLWFKKARNAPPGSSERNFYVWSDTTQLYSGARIIFKDFEASNWTWDPVAGAYYWHRFYSHQPDLNFENPEVHREILRVLDFWMEIGVDGMRLDAVPYLYEQEGTMCENLPQTYDFLRKLRTYIDKKYTGRMLLAEANQWPEDAAAYFGTGDICHMAFHFPLMPRMFMALQMEDWFPIVDILEQTPAIPESCQWAIFLRNHDELTLEMVTEEERDYMYRYYAHDPQARINAGIRKRLAPLLHNSRRRIEIMNILLFSLPGTPIIYYGDEIGMGDNHYLGDRNGVRTPMQWNSDRNSGFSHANPQKLFLPTIIDSEYHYEALNVETQQQNTSSLLWWMKRVIAMRRSHKAFSQGTIQFIKSDNAGIFTFIRKLHDEILFVAINLSRFTQAVSLDLREYAGYIPRDIFSDNRFPIIGNTPYVLTMGFHDYFWLQLENANIFEKRNVQLAIPEIKVTGDWKSLFENSSRDHFEREILPAYLQARKTAGCRELIIKETVILDIIVMNGKSESILVCIVNVLYRHAGQIDTILLPLAFCAEGSLSSVVNDNTGLVMVKLTGESKGYIYDCSSTQIFHESMLRLLTGNRKVNGQTGSIEGYSGKLMPRGVRNYIPAYIQMLKSGRFSTSFDYGGDYHFRLYRRLEEGVRPDVEIASFISENDNSPLTPLFAGVLNYSNVNFHTSLGVMTTYVKHTGTAWNLFLDAALQFFEKILSVNLHLVSPLPEGGKIFNPDLSNFPAEILNNSGKTGITARILGEKTALLHQVLTTGMQNPDFSPEQMSKLYQRSLYQSMRTKARRIISDLRKILDTLPREQAHYGNTIVMQEQKILNHFNLLLKESFSSLKIRIHGHFGLDQFLCTGNDFIIKDFRGPVDIPLSERRLKRSPLRDVAGVIYSFNKVTFTALHRSLKVQLSNPGAIEQWARLWFSYNVSLFMDAYVKAIDRSSNRLFEHRDIHKLTRIYYMERALIDFESGFKAKNIDIAIPVRAILSVLENDET
jgi:maltose alpha-D-glucosyltransferase/alpha-amylase